MGFWKNRWDDVRGNLIWQILTWICGGGILTATGVVVRDLRKLPFSWEFAAIIFVISSLGLAVVTLLASGRPSLIKEVLNAPIAIAAPDNNSAIATLQAQISELRDLLATREDKLNESLLLSGQFKMEADELYADTVFDWLRNNIHGKGTFSIVTLTPSVGLSEDAVRRGVALLRSHQIITQQSPHLDAWTFVAGATPLIPRYKIVAVGKPEAATISLRARTLVLRDAIEKFLDDVGPRPQPEFSPEDSNLTIIRKSREAVEPWYNKIAFGYALHYEEPVRKLFLEYGELGLLPLSYNAGVDQSRPVEESIRLVVERLGTLAAKSIESKRQSA